MSSTTNIVKSTVTRAVIDAIDDSPNVNPSSPELKGIADSVVRDVVPMVLNQTNNEPWYQSRVTWGVIIAAVSTLAKPFIGDLPIDEAQTADITAALATLGQVAGFGLTLYGRWKARKPIGA